MSVCDDWLSKVWLAVENGYSDFKIFKGAEIGLFYKLTQDKTF